MPDCNTGRNPAGALPGRTSIPKSEAFRRIATRYERLARKYPAMLSLAGGMIWLDCEQLKGGGY